MGRKYKVTIEVEYEADDAADPSAILDSFQDTLDDSTDLLTPYGGTVEKFEVSVEDMD